MWVGILEDFCEEKIIKNYRATRQKIKKNYTEIVMSLGYIFPIFQQFKIICELFSFIF